MSAGHKRDLWLSTKASGAVHILQLSTITKGHLQSLSSMAVQIKQFVYSKVWLHVIFYFNHMFCNIRLRI